MKKSIIMVALGLTCALNVMAKEPSKFKEALSKYFYIGAAVDSAIVWEIDKEGAAIVKEYFNSITPENCMKGENIHPQENVYNWVDADQTVKFGQDNNLMVWGHCLVWHSQAPKWMFTDEKGDTVSRSVLIDRMYHHITNVVSRYKGKIKGWDVVNEAFENDGSYRQTPYYKIIGKEYIELAFKFAHEADPNAELYYNDYSMDKQGKREAVCSLVKDLKAKGIRIDGVGTQEHNGTNYPLVADEELTIDALAACGVRVAVTELDINMLPRPEQFEGAEIGQNFEYKDKLDPYTKGLDKNAQQIFDKQYINFFTMFKKHSPQIERVTLWGVGDKRSWLNNFPVPGRTNHSLLFDRDYKPKKVINEIINIFSE